MLYYLCAFTGQRAARYWKYLISGSGASNGSSESVHGSNSTVLRVALAPRGPRGGVEDSTALRERSMHWEGSYADGLAARVCCGIGAVGERALLARVRRRRSSGRRVGVRRWRRPLLVRVGR